MEAKHDPRAHDLPPEAPASPGELVVQNGRLSGTRCPLRAPLTLIGRGEDCDIRVNVKGVGAVHCAISLGSQGAVVRSLNREHRTLVNGEPATQTPLQNGDYVTVGPCRFRVRLTAAPLPAGPAASPPTGPLPPEGLRQEKDALRVQAAAVAAQQAALFEEETRLQQRRVTLERQEKELVAHLEEKRRRLLEAQNQVRQAHAAMQAERAVYEQRVAEMARRLEVERRDLADGRRHVQAERRRLLRLRQRMKKRWHRFWAAERQAMRQREHALEQKTRRLEQGQEALHRARAQFHGEVEPARRELQEGWAQLRREQQQWAEQYARERAELTEHARALEQREADLAGAERAWAEQKQQLETTRANLEREIQGLENRARNERRKLAAQEPSPDPSAAILASEPAFAPALAGPTPGPLVPVEASPPQDWVVLRAVAGELADQRLHLLEQWQRLVQTHQQWQQERELVAAELEAWGRSLQEREQALGHAAERCRQRYDEVLQLRRHLDSRQAQLTVQAVAWVTERDHWRAELQSREDHLERRLAGLDQLRKVWHQRHRQAVTRLRAAYSLCDKLRQEYTLLRRQWLQRTAALADEEKKITQRALVVEQYRQKYLDQAPNPAEAGKRLEQLQQRLSALFARAEADFQQHRRSLTEEMTRLEERYRFLNQALEKVVTREAEVSAREAAGEQQRALAENELARLRQEVQRLQGQREIYEQQIADLREEVERLARQMLVEDDSPALGIGQAA